MLTGVTGGGPNAIVMSGELNLAQAGPPPNGNVVLPPQQPFARSKNKGNNKLLNGFSDDRRDIVMLSREECDRITKKAIKCIRRPGKDFSELFALLADVRGQPSFPAIVERLVIEANRFKRKNLADQLARQLSPIGSFCIPQNASHPSNNNNNNNNGSSLWRMAAAQGVVKR